MTMSHSTEARQGADTVLPARALILLSSYTPLFTILAIRFENRVVMWICIALAAFGVIALLAILALERRVAPGPHTIKAVAPGGGEATAYLASYLLPFVTIAEPGWRDLAGYALFFLVAVTVHIRSSVIQINPLLYVLRYRVSRVQTEEGLDMLLISRSKPKVGQLIRASDLDDGVFMTHEK